MTTINKLIGKLMPKKEKSNKITEIEDSKESSKNDEGKNLNRFGPEDNIGNPDNDSSGPLKSNSANEPLALPASREISSESSPVKLVFKSIWKP